jgi:nicotinamide riboside kinase
MTDLPTTLGETLKSLAPDVVRRQVDTIVSGMGGRASDAVKLTKAEELQAWMTATASPEQVAAMIERGADDDEILQTARRYRYALGKAAAKGDPRKEVEYHEKMAAEAQALLSQAAMGMPTGPAQGAARPT